MSLANGFFKGLLPPASLPRNWRLKPPGVFHPHHPFSLVVTCRHPFSTIYLLSPVSHAFTRFTHFHLFHLFSPACTCFACFEPFSTFFPIFYPISPASTSIHPFLPIFTRLPVFTHFYPFLPIYTYFYPVSLVSLILYDNVKRFSVCWIFT